MRSKTSAVSAILALLLAFTACHRGEVLSIDPIYSSGAVLQQESLVTIGGRAIPGTHIMVSTDWDFYVSTSTGADSMWSAQIRTPAADTLRHRLTVSSGEDTHFITDILIGEVWLAVGQTGTLPPPYSHHLFAPDNAGDTVVATNVEEWPVDSMARVFKSTPGVSVDPVVMAQGRWYVLSPDNHGELSISAATIAKALRDSLRIPVGVVLASLPGAPCRAWCQAEMLSKDQQEEVGRELSDWSDKHRELNGWLETLQMLDVTNPDGTSSLPTVSVYDEFINMSKVDTASCPVMQFPGLWARQGLPSFDGVAWLIKDVRLPESFHRYESRLVLGDLADNDLTYVNQTYVGSKGTNATGVYPIPRGTITNHATIAVRLNGSAPTAGLYGPKDGTPIRLEFVVGDSTLWYPITGDWACLAVAKFTSDHKRLYLMGVPNNRYMMEFREAESIPKTLHSVAYNKMIAPLSGFPVAGVACHFGETDMNYPQFYDGLTSNIGTLVKTLRGVFGDEKLPVFFNQPAPAPVAIDVEGGRVRSVIVDAVNELGGGVYVTSLADMHEGSRYNTMASRQHEEGRRCAAAIYETVYGGCGGRCGLSPMPRAAYRDYQVVNVQFDYADSLMVDTSLPSAFEVAAADSMFYPARALSSGCWVTVFSHMVQEPKYVRYAYSDTIAPTLFNGNGLPAPAFSLVCADSRGGDR